MMSQQWFFHWDNAPLFIAALVLSWCDAHSVQHLNHCLIHLIWFWQTFSYSKKPKWGLAGWSLDQDGIKNAWEGVPRSLIAVDLAATFRSWLECCKKCVRIGGKFVKKS